VGSGRGVPGQALAPLLPALLLAFLDTLACTQPQLLLLLLLLLLLGWGQGQGG